MVDKKKYAFGASAGIAAAVATILGGVYQNEGWYSDNKNDRGGKTTWGVTEVVARDEGWKGDMKAFPKQCDSADDICADKVYYQRYIESVGYVPIIAADPFIGEELVDTGVNMGPAKPSTWLQQSINLQCPSAKLVADGRVGPGTQKAFVACQAQVGKVAFCKATITYLDAKQKDRYNWIVANNPSQKVFLRGWLRLRIGNVDIKQCESLVAPVPAPVPNTTPKV